jgi:hypothetical protein
VVSLLAASPDRGEAARRETTLSLAITSADIVSADYPTQFVDTLSSKKL